ncbi:Reductases with broad range of substrate specificities [Phaffia rhodozyma]|uniref:Reductases with broad range of substrate specificities n=1 Tax=Phaffia rhodozyma TaxID=264483 RepID=A0A0F7SK76_PHARH|nr:Reductases with broad range of substrate specificities [Phaffia rhodozyma]
MLLKSLAEASVVYKYTSLIPPFRRLATTASLWKKKDSIPKKASEPAFQMAPKPIVGVQAALKAQSDPGYKVAPQIFKEFSQAGKVAVITGANGGLGLEMALALCEAGGTVYGTDLAETPSDDYLASQNFVKALNNGGALHYIQGEVTVKDSITGVIDQVVKKEGKINVAIAAAGILGTATGFDCWDFPEAEFKKIFDVNVNGVFYTAQAAAKHMVDKKNSGSIILIASMSGTVVNRDERWTAYNASKSAVLQMTRSMAAELGPHDVRVNSLSPGHIYTNMTAARLDKEPGTAKRWCSLNPMGRLGGTHEVRGVVAWLASDASSFCTGSDIIVSGGHTVCPVL